MPSLSEVLQPFSAVVITGGSSGIGKSFIQLCGRLRPDLVFCNLSRRDPGENISSNPAKRLNHFCCDLRNPGDLARAAAGVRAYLAQTAPEGGVLLINNSGFGSFGAFPELNLASELEMIDVNVRALVQLTGLLLPDLLSRGGVVLNVASTVAFQPSPYAATYGATKAFVLNWTIALNEELRGTRARALAVSPGTTATPFFATAGIGTKATASALTLSADEVAQQALQALASGRSHVVTGWGNKLYTWLGARLPKAFAARLTARVMRKRRPGARSS